MPIDPNEQVDYNGTLMAVKDVPDPMIRIMLGYGHYNPDDRPVVPGEWAYTPDTCPWTDPEEGTEWIHNSTVLICKGCGLDVT